jgi:hypothetical protein
MKTPFVFGLLLVSALTFFSHSPLVFATSQVKESEVTKTVYLTQAEVEARTREYFKDTPVMIEIARCESKFRQFTDAGNVLRGGSAGGMVGVFQFFESIHSTPAKALGFDITTLEGNLGYAKHVYTTEGTTPWNSAKACWNVPTTTTPTLAIKASKADLQKQVDLLMQLITLLKQLQSLKGA